MNSDMIIRITRYYRILNRLRSLGLEKVFAHNLADAAGVSAAVVRKDFSLLEIHGQKRTSTCCINRRCDDCPQ